MVGSVFPSSAHLSKAMCQHVHGAQHIVELGAGTGAVTEHLDFEFPRTPLMVVERDVQMARALQQRFHRAEVVSECIHQRPDLLRLLPDCCVIVSSLPFRSLPVEVATQTIKLIEEFLLQSPARKLVQYTYGMGAPFVSPHSRLKWRRQEFVLLNLPPASVWTLQA